VALGAFAVVAMAATFGAAAQATFTAIVFVFELTRDYDVILPLMLATVIADIVYSSVNHDSLMTEKLRRRGLHVGRHYGVDPFSSTVVGDIMTTDVETLPASATVGEARARFAAGGHGAYPILDGDQLAGIVARGDLIRDRCVDAGPLIDHATAQVLTVSPTDQAQVALQIMADESIEHLPVVAGDRLVGICTRSDLLKVRRRQYELERPQDGLVARAGDVLVRLRSRP
jgi:CIC family chloride channel protein